MRYFEEINSELKAYVLGVVVFNISKVRDTEITLDITTVNPLILSELQRVSVDGVISNKDDIQDICRHLDVTDLSSFYNISISSFVKNNKKEYVTEFMKAFYEKYGNIYFGDTTVCNITSNHKDNLITFAEFFNIPYVFSNLFNLVQLTYTNVNVIDLVGMIYKNRIYIKEKTYADFLTLLNNERPLLKYTKISDQAITPTKANFSDAGYDISTIGIAKVLNASTTLYHTGIKLDIPVGYYVELVPRSSISKSGYMLANSIGIIDCSYKGELLVALTKQADCGDIIFPFKCCQIIMKKQIFADMQEVEDVSTKTNRSEGGFGSTN